MKGSRLVFIFLIIAAVIAAAGYFGVRYLKNKQVVSRIEEYTPQEEVTDAQLRKTMVNLYFYNNETGELEPEARLIDAVELLQKPYAKLIKMLIQGPKSDKLKALIPEEVKINSAKIKEGCVTVDFSQDILNYTEDEDLKNKMINSVVNTLTELIEVDSVKFLIDGEKNDMFKEEYVRI